jgi:hypothetical protein
MIALVSVLQMQAARRTCVLLPSTPAMKSPTANAPLQAMLSYVWFEPSAAKSARKNCGQTLLSEMPLHTSTEPSRRGKFDEPAAPRGINTYTIKSPMLPDGKLTWTLPPAIVESTRPMPHWTGGAEGAAVFAFCWGTGARAVCCCGS